MISLTGRLWASLPAALIFAQVSAADAQTLQKAQNNPSFVPMDVDALEKKIIRDALLVQTVKHYARYTGAALRTLNNDPSKEGQNEGRRMLADAVNGLQEAIIEYRTVFGNAISVFTPVTKNGALGKSTASLLLEIAAHGQIKEILIDAPGTHKNEVEATDYRFLRKRLQQLSPDTYVTSLQMLIGQVEMERRNTEQSVSATAKSAFYYCARERNSSFFAPDLLLSEVKKLQDNPNHISAIVPPVCHEHLSRMSLHDRLNAQLEFIISAPRIKAQDATWCRLILPNIGEETRIDTCIDFRL